MRLSAVLASAGILSLVVLRAWRVGEADLQALDHWTPSDRAVRTVAIVSGLILAWIVLTRFWSGEINAVDFTVYFDRPCYQTTTGRPLFIETADDPLLGQQGQLAQHAYWGLFLLCTPYLIAPSPFWLLLVSVLAPVLGAIYIRRLAARLGFGGILASTTALVFLLNDNTARAMSYGFHPEILYAWFIPWMLDAGFRGARRSFLAAAFGCLLVKEDACLALLAVSATLGIHRWRLLSRADRWLLLVLPGAAGLANLAIYYALVLPRLSAWPPLNFLPWSDFGTTPATAIASMMGSPTAILAAVLASGIWTTVLLPHLFLPLAAWRWLLGTVPIVVLFSASSSEQIRTFGVYYAIMLVPFLVLGASRGALDLAGRALRNAAHARLAAAALVAASALLIGAGNRGYSLRPWRPEIAAAKDAVGRLAHEGRVLVQSSLYPHVGYDGRFELLTPHALDDPQSVGVAVLLAPSLGMFPFADGELVGHQALRIADRLPGGLLLARVQQ